MATSFSYLPTRTTPTRVNKINDIITFILLLLPHHHTHHLKNHLPALFSRHTPTIDSHQAVVAEAAGGAEIGWCSADIEIKQTIFEALERARPPNLLRRTQRIHGRHRATLRLNTLAGGGVTEVSLATLTAALAKAAHRTLCIASLAGLLAFPLVTAHDKLFVPGTFGAWKINDSNYHRAPDERASTRACLTHLGNGKLGRSGCWRPWRIPPCRNRRAYRWVG